MRPRGSWHRRALCAAVLSVVAWCQAAQPAQAAPTIAGCPVLPADNVWNTPIDSLPVHPRSADYISRIGATATVHADFGSGVWPPGSDSPIGIPYVTVTSAQPDVAVSFTYASESDPGPYPIPPDAPIEGGPSSSGDRHVLVVNETTCVLSEVFAAYPHANGSWSAGSGAVFDLTSNALRPSGWTSADAAGLPILPGLVRYEEVAAGVIEHAIRFTAPQTQRAYVWPARHFASSITNPAYPPMGQRFRLEASFDISGFSRDARVILQAMKTYGLILADNGSPWYISGAPDERWDNGILHELHAVPGSAFEAVDATVLMAEPNSGAVAVVGDPVVHVVGGSAAVSDAVAAAIWQLVGPTDRIAGPNRYATAAALSERTFDPGVPVVVVARGDTFPDALSAGPLAATLGGPVLLTTPTALPGPTRDELTRLQPAEIIVAGGAGAVSAEVVTALGAYTAGPVTRIGGADRYATSALLSATQGTVHPDRVYLTTGESHPDALSAGAAAARDGTSVLLTRSTSLPAVTAVELLRIQPTEVVIVGGTSAVAGTVQSQVEALGVATSRLWGANRYATSAAVSAAMFPPGGPVYVATGVDHADALSAVAVAGRSGVPVLLVTPAQLPGPIATELQRLL